MGSPRVLYIWPIGKDTDRCAAPQKMKEETMTQELQADQKEQLEEATAAPLIETDLEEQPEEDTANSWISNIWKKIKGNS
ncbi:MAG: hypothetical protein ACI8Z0_000619 [Lentimonas sp.]|jgi:hypothetical protein